MSTYKTLNEAVEEVAENFKDFGNVNAVISKVNDTKTIEPYCPVYTLGFKSSEDFIEKCNLYGSKIVVIFATIR